MPFYHIKIITTMQIVTLHDIDTKDIIGSIIVTKNNDIQKRKQNYKVVIDFGGSTTRAATNHNFSI